MITLESIKKEREYKKSKYYDLYINCLNTNKLDLEHISSCIKKYQNELNKQKESSSPSNALIKRAEEEIKRWKFDFDKKIAERDFIRPNNDLDIEERKEIFNNYADKLKAILKNNTNLRFHATPIYNAKKIIETGHITSSANRYDGYISSTDKLGEFSASKVSDVDKSINFYMDVVAYQRSLPCGVMFVLNERVGDDELRKYDTMQNVDIRNNKNTLEGIICTKESVDMIKKTCAINGIDYKKVYTFDEFLEHAIIISNNTEQEISIYNTK